jgi:hypothetical protein
MSRIVHLTNGATIKADVVESFDRAIKNPVNFYTDGSINWNFVDADMNLDCGFYSASYISECFEVLADEYELNKSWDMLNVLRTDYLGLEAV